jgi:hypothetical protein
MDESQKQTIERAMEFDIFVLDNPNMKCYIPGKILYHKKRAILRPRTEILIDH